MNNLFLLTIFIPILNVLAIIIKYDASRVKSVFIDILSKITPLIFFVILLGFYRHISAQNIEIIEFNSVITFGFKADRSVIEQLFLLAFLWIIIIFYSERFLLIDNQNANNFKLFCAIFFAIINLIILSSNLTTTIFCYNFLLLIFIFLLTNHLFKNITKSSYIFIFLTIFEAILLFLMMVILVQFNSEISYNKNGVIINASKAQTLFVIILFFAAILLTILSSAYLLFYKNFNFNSLTNYLSLPLFYGLVKIFIFTKIITQIFGIGLFSMIISQEFAHFIEFIFMINILTSLTFMLFGKDFKTMFLHLFFNQLSFSFLTIFILAFYDEGEILNVLPAFCLTMTLIFMGFSNLVLYLKNAKNKEFNGIFYDLKVTISITIFGLLSLIGIVPSLNMMQNFALLSLILANKLLFTFMALIINSLGLALFTYKLFFVAFLKNLDNKDESDKMLASKIDGSSGMSLGALFLAFIIFLLPIIKLIL